jgi:hypothetical protein
MAGFRLEQTRLVHSMLLGAPLPPALEEHAAAARAICARAFAAAAAVDEAAANAHGNWFAACADRLVRAVVASGDIVGAPPPVLVGTVADIVRATDNYARSFLGAQIAGLLSVPRLQIIQAIIDEHCSHA